MQLRIERTKSTDIAYRLLSVLDLRLGNIEFQEHGT
jgi:hypothetical protein